MATLSRQLCVLPTSLALMAFGGAAAGTDGY